MVAHSLVEQGEKRRAQILAFVQEFIDTNGYSPSIAEICNGVGVVSPNAVRNHLQRMQEDGVIDVTPRVARSIRIRQEE